jgi:mannose-6-phosphate isomerase-like protein (cupin superfamily)
MFKIINSNNSEIVESTDSDLYQYTVFIGKNHIYLDPKSSYWYVDKNSVVAKTGDRSTLISDNMCVEIAGYTPETRTSTFNRGTDLPYINGCSTKQLIPAVRPGDPTFQMLYIPAGTSEQAHHIHATARVVYVVSGSGKSIVGTPGNNTSYDLNKGDVIILPKMVPHHFKTEATDLLVLPVHIFSSIGSEEFNHPMFNGTHKV